ncbi:deoxynucleoside triphosphate triphosphohydrolase SAMHD1-like, partial [Sinocyclocheilus rhinocerous]|uniref:deoxynucleoside triphosphate triphosphohydrolase SAMHD1-like n=1 Tax=Sinocyclocheilus rhinocerous TaxID=307959 RepID=UPI0007B8A898
VSSLLPEKFTEYVRVYYTKNSDEEEKDANNCFGWWRHDKCKILVYDQKEFRGNECLITGDCPSLDDCGIKEVQSCKVRRGFWKLYEGRDYNEAEYLLEPRKEYHSPTDWGSQSNASARSLKHNLITIIIISNNTQEHHQILEKKRRCLHLKAQKMRFLTVYEGRDEDKSFLYEIVANKQNGMDVDKWDYFARDCHHLGIRNSFDHQRLLKFARVCEVNGRKHICFRDKEADNVYDMFRPRYTHRQAYQHKIGYIIDTMLAEALVRADRDLHEGKPEDMLKISEAIKTAEDYSKLTDEIFEQILSSTADNLKKSRDILNKIVRRKLPKFVAEARLTENSMSKEELTETWKAAVEKYKRTDPTVSLNAEDFSVYVVDLDYGMKDKNPIEKVYFYSKRKPNEASAINDYQLSSVLPQRFNEELVRVYYKNTDENKEELKKKVEEAEKCFQIWCESKFGLH